MALKRYKPTTPSQRQLVNIDRADLWKGSGYKLLTEGLKKSGGRNHHGRITVWNRGGGHKRRYRIIDFKREFRNVEGEVTRIEYDPNRSAFIALVEYPNKEMRYMIAPQKIAIGDKIIAGDKVDVKPGNAMKLRNMPMGSVVHNLELKIGKGAQIARSAGNYAQVMGRDGHNVIVKMCSGEVRLIHGDCMATVGAVSNQDHSNRSYGKAGRSRWLGKRPNVRGVAMNPIDHPHGGGEGRTSGGRHPVTPWGKPTKGKKTRHNKRTTSSIIRRRK